MKSVWMFWCVCALGVGCSSSTTSSRRVALRGATGLQTGNSAEDHSRCDSTRPGRTASEYDTNNDGVNDVRKVYQTMGEARAVHSVLVCREADLNHDGTKDVFRFYNDEGRTLREEADRDFDGHIDVITYFEGGEVVRREFDTNRDGQVDMRIYYRDHMPYRAERELSNDRSPEFRPDYWEFYDSHGRVVRIGWDYDHDGRADRWDRVDRVAPVRTVTTINRPTPFGEGVDASAPSVDSDASTSPMAESDAASAMAPAPAVQPTDAGAPAD